MVPKTTSKNTLKNSNLKTLVNIFDELLIIAKEMQKSVLTQDWDRLNDLAGKQQMLNQHFDKALLKTAELDNKDDETAKFKETLKKKIIKYNELENINARLLNDAFYVSKQKVDKYFKPDSKNNTYTKEMKKGNNLWNNQPVILDRTV